MILKQIIDQPDWQMEEVGTSLLRETVEKALRAGRVAGWKSVNNAVLTRNALAMWRDIGWELILDHFRAIGWEKQEEEEEGEDDPIERMLEYQVNHIGHLNTHTKMMFP